MRFWVLAAGVLACTALRLHANSPGAAAAPRAIPIWPAGKMPGTGAKDPEKDTGTAKGQSWCITNVSKPTIRVYLAAKAGAPTPAVLICPGGGYGMLSYSLEGTDIATWLKSIGVTGVVLKYRVPNNRDGAFQDIERAMRLVRSRAKKWNIDPKRLGVMGFSAGGHLCARLATNGAVEAYPKIDAIDNLDCRPAFVVLNYPAYLGKDGKVAPELPISRALPPLIMFQAADDEVYLPGTRIFDSALSDAHIPHDFTVFPDGGHGYGIRTNHSPKVWPDLLRAWLHDHGILSS
ncbi:MAG: alpha/beta hydrolase [Verrucomicrobiota bacterium]